MNCDSCDEPKNSLIATTTGPRVMRASGVTASTRWGVMRPRTRRVRGRRLARTELAVDVDERLVDAGGVILLERVAHRLVGAALFVDDQVQQLLVALTEAQRLQQDRDRLLALAVDADVHDVLLVDFELEPGTAARDDLGVDDLALRCR